MKIVVIWLIAVLFYWALIYGATKRVAYENSGYMVNSSTILLGIDIWSY